MKRKSKERARHILIPIDIYGCWVHFFWDYEDDELNRILEHKFGREQCRKLDAVSPLFAGWCARINCSHYVVFVKGLKWNSFCWGTLVHELIHCIFKALADRGIFGTPDTEDVFAYLAGYLTREVVKRYNKFNSKKEEKE